MASNPKKQRIIWLPTGGHFGDAILITALFAEIIELNPDVQITYVLRRNAGLIAQIGTEYPQSTVIPLPSKIIPVVQMVLSLLRDRATVIVPPPRNAHPLFIKILATLFLFRGDTVIGFSREANWFKPYSTHLWYKDRERYIDNLRDAFTHTEIQTRALGEAPHLLLPSALPANFPYANSRYILIHPFPHMATYKTLPPHRWVDLIKKLHEEYPTYGIVVTGAKVDAKDAKIISDTAAVKELCLAIDRPFSELSGLIQHAALYIGVDTGPTHLAGVVHAPSVIVAQQNDPVWLTTYDPNAVHLWSTEHCICRIPGESCEVSEDGKVYRRCVYYLPDEELLAAIREKLAMVP